MPVSFSPSRADLLGTLQHALERSRLLARDLSEDPVVGGEASALLGQLDCIQAEVDVIASVRSASEGAGQAATAKSTWPPFSS